MKNKLMWFYHCWNSVMDLKYNPIGYVRDTSVQMYLMIVLSVLWTLTFCGLIAGWMNVIPLIYGHIAFIYDTTLCPKCASKKVFAKGTASAYGRR